MIKLSFRLALFVLAVLSVVVLWQQAQLTALALGRIDPVPETRLMLEEKRYAAAWDYLSFFMDYDYVNQNPEAQQLHREISQKRSSWEYQLIKLGEGVISGTSDEAIGKTASIISDFFVIGDVRDLAAQGVNLIQGEEVDKTLVALASLGAVATAAQVTSGVGTVATAGAAAPAAAGTTLAKSGLVTLKTARKLGKLPNWLNKSIIQSAKSAKQTKSLGALTNMFGDISTLAKTRGGIELLGQTKNATELRRMARFADAFGAKSATMYRIGGNMAVEIAQRADKLGKETIMLATTFGKNGLKLLSDVGVVKFTKIASRTTKIGYKNDMFNLLTHFLQKIPSWILYLLIVLGAVVWIPQRVLMAFGRRIFYSLQGKRC